MNFTGKLLIAPPSIRGNFWQKTVIFCTEHHHLGAMGLVLNKPMKITLKEFCKQVGMDVDVQGNVYVGGPVNSKALTLIHSGEWSCENTMQINNHFAISSHVDLLEKIVAGDMPNKWRLVLGLCAWTPDQLDSEVIGKHPYNHNQSWLLATPTYQNVFELDQVDQWTHSIECSSMEFVQKVLA